MSEQTRSVRPELVEGRTIRDRFVRASTGSARTVVAWILLTLCLTGCGYSTSRLLPVAYRTIYVEPLQNRIPITEEVNERLGYQANLPRLQEDVTRGVIDRFLFDGNLRVTTKREEADLVLDGEIVDFLRQPVRRLDDGSAEEYRLNLTAHLTLRDRKGTLVFEEPGLVGDTTYFVTGSSAVAETVAVGDLITDFSRRVVERVVENW